ncbi:MAG: hypothetical protein U5K75_02840 [Ahrensia sp.]|nr:hypothetical protein [Ahrensia sp.]
MPTQDDLGGRMITGDPAGERIALTLEVIDGAGDPLTDAMVEIWQAGPDGTYGPTDGFTHWGRQPADAQTGQLMFETLLPGAAGRTSTAYIGVGRSARGISCIASGHAYLFSTS